MSKSNTPERIMAKNLIERFTPHAYPFAGGSGFMTGEIDEDSQRQAACDIAIDCIGVIIDFSGVEQDEKFFWSQVKLELENIKEEIYLITF